MPDTETRVYISEQIKNCLPIIRIRKKLATLVQLSLAWMVCKKPYVVPIPGSRKIERLLKNAGAADIELTIEEVTAIDDRLDNMEMSGVFGESPVK